jgi:hypothetical protein
LRAIFVGFAIVVLCPWLADAQEQAPAQQGSAAVPQNSAEPESTRETLKKIASRHEELSKLLDPSKYPPAFEVGAQAEFLPPASGVSALVLGYDATWMLVNVDVGIGMGGDPITNKDAADVYSFDVRIAVPVHRGVRADFSLLAGGGATLIAPPKASRFTVGDAVLGTQLRVFQTPNVALIGTLGLAALIRSGNTLYVFGAKPLGAASIVYFFR